MTELIPEQFRELLEFYSRHYPDARFGSLDLPALQQALAALEVAAQDVIAAEAAVVQAREAFGAAEADVLSKAQRAVSFLKIHVEGDNQQVTRLESIGNSLDAQRRKSKPGSEGPAPTPPEARPRRQRKGKDVGAVQLESLLTAGVTEQAVSSVGFEVEAFTPTEPESASTGLRSEPSAAE